MVILTIDTQAEFVSAALATGNARFAVEALAGMSHSELLFDMIESLFKFAGIERESLDIVAVMRGPGSWTGLRIGYAAAQGISLASGARVVTVPSLDCAAHPYSHFDGAVLCAFDAKQRRFFCAAFLNGKRAGAALDASPEEIIELLSNLAPQKKVLLTGNGAELLLEKLHPIAPPESRFVLDPRFRRGRAPEIIDYIEHNPALLEEDCAALIYLRASDAEINLSDKAHKKSC